MPKKQGYLKTLGYLYLIHMDTTDYIYSHPKT
jgi:hypothetical protein